MLILLDNQPYAFAQDGAASISSPDLERKARFQSAHATSLHMQSQEAAVDPKDPVQVYRAWLHHQFSTYTAALLTLASGSQYSASVQVGKGWLTGAWP